MVKLQVRGWSEYNPRKDFKEPKWFALSNKVLEKASIYALDGDEFRAFIYILCQCSQNNSDTICINLEHADRVSKISAKKMLSSIEKLQVYDIIQNVQAVDLTKKATNFTLHNNTLHNSTIHTCGSEPADADVGVSTENDLHEVGKIWNENCGSLAKVKSTLGKRKQKCVSLLKQFGRDALIEGVKKVAASHFCNGGGNTGWKANFDWFIKPESAQKAIEGNYDGKPGSGIIDRNTENSRKVNATDEMNQMMAEIEAELEAENAASK